MSSRLSPWGSHHRMAAMWTGKRPRGCHLFSCSLGDLPQRPPLLEDARKWTLSRVVCEPPCAAVSRCRCVGVWQWTHPARARHCLGILRLQAHHRPRAPQAYIVMRVPCTIMEPLQRTTTSVAPHNGSRPSVMEKRTCQWQTAAPDTRRIIWSISGRGRGDGGTAALIHQPRCLWAYSPHSLCDKPCDHMNERLVALWNGLL